MGRPQHRQRAICREEDFTFRSMRTDLRTSFVPEQLHHFLIPTASRYDVILFQLPLHSSSSLCCPPGAVHPPMHPTGCLGLAHVLQDGEHSRRAGEGGKRQAECQGWGDGARAIPGCSHGMPPAHRPARLLLPCSEDVAGCGCGQVLVAVP